MPIEEVLAPLIAGGIFAYLYGVEKDFLLKFVFLFTSMSIIIFSFFNDYILTTTTYDSATGITTGTYALSNFLNPYGIGLGALLIFLIAYFVWKLVKAVRSAL